MVKREKTTTIVKFMLILCALLVAATPKAHAEGMTLFGDYLKEKGIEITSEATLDFYDKYVWRGQYLDLDPVVQPGISFSTYGVTVGYWGSLPMGSTRDSLDSAESDYYIDYSYTFDPLTISVGHTWYEFSGGSTSSKEAYVALSADVLLSPTFMFYHDYEDGKTENGNYYALNVSHSIPVWEEYGVTADLGLTYGFNDGQWLAGEGTHLTPTLGLTLPLTANLSVTPTIGYNWTMGDLEDSNVGNFDSKFFGGVSSAFTF